MTRTSQPVAPVPVRRPALVGPGLLAVIAAAVVTTAVAAVARAAGVDFELPDGGEAIPASGFTTVTVVLSVLGVAMAAGIRRWAARPAVVFLRVAVALTAVSLVPPFLVDAHPTTALTLVGLHLLAAAIVVPVLVSRLRASGHPTPAGTGP